MDHEQGSYSLRALFISVAFFALATFLITLDFKVFKQGRSGPMSSDFVKLLVLSSGPLIGGILGIAIGVLTGNLHRTTTDGAIAGFLVATIFLIWWAIPGIR